MGATFEQAYAHILEEFVAYCNEQPKIMRLDHLDALMYGFIDKKMERYR